MKDYYVQLLREYGNAYLTAPCNEMRFYYKGFLEGVLSSAVHDHSLTVEDYVDLLAIRNEHIPF